jgi:hypothetical protein
MITIIAVLMLIHIPISMGRTAMTTISTIIRTIMAAIPESR